MATHTIDKFKYDGDTYQFQDNVSGYITDAGVTSVTVTQTLASGTEIGSISVNGGTATKLYAPEGGGASVTTVQVAIATSDWSSQTATKTVSGVSTSNVIVIAGDPSTRDVYNAAGIYAYSQATDSVTFKCDTTPTGSVTVNVMIFEQFSNADATSY